MDGLTFHKVMGIIRRRYTQGKINKVSVLKDQLYISLYKDGHTVLTFKSTPPPSLETAEIVQGDSAGVLSNLSGAVIVDTGGRDYDRLGWIILEKRRASGKLMKYQLVLEPMGNYANAFLLGEDGTILFRLSSRNIDADRDIGVGKAYIRPKANKKYNLDDYHPEITDFKEFTGFYPLTANLAAGYAGESGFKNAAAFIKEELENDCFYIENGKVLPFPANENSVKISFEELHISTSAKDKKNTQLADRLRKFYGKQLKHYQKLHFKLGEELSDAEKYASILEEADLIKANLHIIKGIGKYDLTLYSAEGAREKEYIFNSPDSPAVYADKLYKRGAKLKRSVPLLKLRIIEVEQMEESAKEQLYFVEDASEKDLKELSELMKEKPKHKQAKRTEQGGFLEFHKDGALIYIGRNSASNHKLVFQFALAGDMWFHARNIPSAHCIVRYDGELNDGIIEFAARLTASYSKNKREARVSIDYTLRKYVKKPKNTPIGFVTYDKFKTITVFPFSEKELGEFTHS